MIEVVAIKLQRAENLLIVSFDNETTARLPAEYLRVESPSAEVQGHHGADKKLVAGKRGIAITGIERVGNYAVRLIFSDGHDTGIFSWDELHRLAGAQASLWPAYLDRLNSAGLAR